MANIITIPKGQTDWHNQVNANFDTLNTKKKGRVTLWAGAWGANGSADLTIPNLTDYEVLGFVFNGVHFEARRVASAISIGIINARADGQLRIYAIGMTATGNTLSLASNIYLNITTAGSISITSNPSNYLTEVYGVLK